MAKEKQTASTAPLISPEEFLLAVDEEIQRLPKNVIRAYLEGVKRLHDEGCSWKQIADILSAKTGLQIKTLHVKTAYFDAYPAEKKTRRAKEEKLVK